MKEKARVLLLGDSIRLGYQTYVKEGLGNDVETVYPEQNGCDVSTTLWQANQIFKHQGDFDLIHWNNGYWDMNIEAPMTEALHPIEEYKHFLVRMVKFFSQHTKHLVFATSLPIKFEGSSLDNSGTGGMVTYNNKWVQEYNAAAKEIMNEYGVPINDLYQICLADKNYYKCPDNLHLTDEGYQTVAKEIVSLISGKLAD